MRIKDSHELAWQDWQGTAGFDRAEDHWPRRWAEAYVDFAAGEKRAWLRAQGVRIFPVVGWAERGGYGATGHGNSVPRFHITWGTGPGLVEPFERRVRAGVARGLVELRFRHRVTGLARTARAPSTRSPARCWEPATPSAARPAAGRSTGAFELRAQAVIVTSGGIGGNHDLVRANWPERLGTPPAKMLSGVPAHVDGLMLGITEKAGGRLINRDRMWHYTEGIENWNPIWARHGIRILPGPSSLWLDATGKRLPVPLFPGFDTLGTLEHIMRTGHGYTWFVLNQKIIEKEFALSGSEQNPDLTGKSVRDVLGRARAGVARARCRRSWTTARTSSSRATSAHSCARMNALTGDAADRRGRAAPRDRGAGPGDRATPSPRTSRSRRSTAPARYLGDKLIRVAAPHRLLDPAAGPLIAVRLNILTRKTLGGLETDLSSRVLAEDGGPLPGVYAAGEAAGFGGGGVHGYRSLEGTFLGGCLFSGRTAGRAAARAVG